MNSTSAFQLKGTLFALTVVQLLKTDLEAVSLQLASLIQKTPKFFQNAPIVLDLNKTQSLPTLDFVRLHHLLTEQGLIPVGVKGGTPIQHEAAKAAGFAVLPNDKVTEPDPVQERELHAVETHTSNILASENKTITKPVRSGQQVYAKGDLIVFAPVSAGAEIIAGGNIHVYGPLRGRALAGVDGDVSARIFCHSLEAELISIAGYYRVKENLSTLPSKTPMYAFLKKQTVEILPIES